MSLLKPAANFRTAKIFNNGLLLLLLMSVLLFGIFYLTHDHTYLANWFRSLYPCFYRNDTWEQIYFTEAVKQKGNWLCIGGMVGAVVLAILAKRQNNTLVEKPLVVLKPIDFLYFLLLGITGCWLWYFAYRRILPYNDEVFSAVHCAEIHPFQTVAYYMLPNNHIFFNLLNNLLFPFADDHVVTGRILSGLCFLAILGLLYLWCRQLLGQRLLAFMASLAIVVHFQTWGFGAMGRGYELYLLCVWASFIFLWQYFRRGGSIWLKLYTVSVVVGFFTLPTFLLLYIPLSIVAVLAQAYRRKIDWQWVRYSAIAMIAVFLCYLPAFCFSGIASFTENEFVRGADVSYLKYYDTLIVKMHEALEYCFTGYFTVDEDVYLIIAAVPLLSFLWIRKRSHVFLGGFFLLTWVLLFLISWKLKQFPFLRNLLAHMSITYAFIIIVVCWAMQKLVKWVRLKPLIFVLFPIFLATFFYHYIKLTDQRLARSLYHFDINTYSELLAMNLREIPKQSVVAISDESFFHYYIGKKQNLRTTLCGDQTAEYYMLLQGEPTPQLNNAHYELKWERGDFRVFHREPGPAKDTVKH